MIRLSYIPRWTIIKHLRLTHYYVPKAVNSIRFNSYNNKPQLDFSPPKREQNEIDPLNINDLFPDPNQNLDKKAKNEVNANEEINLSASKTKEFERESLLSDIDSYVQEYPISEEESNSRSKEKKESDVLNEFLKDHDREEVQESEIKKQDNDEFSNLLSSLNLGDSFSASNEDSTGDFEKLSEMTKEHILNRKDKANDADDFKLVDVDKNDENIFDISFLDVKEPSDNSNKVINEEKNLFQNIFNSYIEPNNEDERSQLMQNLRDSVNISKNQIDDILKSTTESQPKLSNVSVRLKDELFTKTKDALNPTIEHLLTSQDLNSPKLLVKYLKGIFGEWFDRNEKAQNDNKVFEEVYLNKLLRKSNKFGEKHDTFINSIYIQSMEEPGKPILNVFTLPIIFNAILNILSMKYHDGQLALSLFNFLKKDINLYTVCCNQQTYNEILRTQWVYYGKSNLYGIEMIYIEMLNNGFPGDIITFNILKQIILDYHKLKMGQSDLSESKLPIWTKEDDKRVENLERKLSNLADVLKTLGM